ncbi:heme exporter protein CcmD [Thermaurantiacus sp.]
MAHTPFIVGAYAVTFILLGGLAVVSWLRMRRAERGGD